MALPVLLTKKGGYSTEGRDYDGSNDSCLLSTPLTGLSDGKEGTISFWINKDVDDAVEAIFNIYNDAAANRLNLRMQADNTIKLDAFTSAGGLTLDIDSVATFLAASGWQHYISSWDLANAVAHVYVDGVVSEDIINTTDNEIDYTSATHNYRFGGFGATPTFEINMCASEIYFIDEYIDLDVAGNLAKFISGGKPVYLGDTGNLPTGNAALIYAPNGDLSTNLGADDFTVVGALDVCATSPSD